ncbi:MAG: polysaccharide biosynthesis tyrosine autokinase [Bryobacteraceae bacterium]
MRPDENPDNAAALQGQRGGPLQPRYRFGPDTTTVETHEARAPIDFLGYWSRIWRNRGIVAGVAIAATAFGWLSTLPQQPVFQARTLLELQGFNENFMNFKDVSPTSSSTYFPEVDTMTQVKLLQTRPLIEQVEAKLRTEGKFRLEPRRNTWKAKAGLVSADPADRDTAIAVAASGLTIKASATTRIIEIVCDSPDPELAAAFANTLAESYIEMNLESRWKATQKTGEWLTRQMRDLKAKWEEAEDELNRYAVSSNLMFTGQNGGDNVAEEKLRQLQTELSKAQADRVANQSRHELALSGDPERLGEVLESESLRSYKQKLAELRRQAAELSATLTPEHYRVKRVEAQLAQMQTDLDRERANIVQRIRADFEGSRKREQLLEAAYETQSQLVSRQSSQSIQYNILKRDAETSRQMYESMLQKVKEANVASALRASSVRIVEPAYPPSAPYRPDRRRGAILGCIAGIFFGAGLVLLRERMDRTLHKPGDPELYLRVPELGHVPRADYGVEESFRQRLANSVTRRITDPAGDLASLGAVIPKEAEMFERTRTLARGRRNSFVTEAFRGIVTSVLFSQRNRCSRLVLAVTSASPAEGKTLTVAHLAIAFAEIHRRVLVIDADLRRPKIHQLFNVNREFGLADLLANEVEPDAAAALTAIQPTTVRGLWTLTSGRSPEVSANLLHSMRLGPLIESLAAHFDIILIDTPPILTLSDPRAVAFHADGTILVVRSGKTTRDAASMAKQQLEADGRQVVGVVLNDWDPGQSGAYGYDNYGDYYRAYTLETDEAQA